MTSFCKKCSLVSLTELLNIENITLLKGSTEDRLIVCWVRLVTDLFLIKLEGDKLNTGYSFGKYTEIAKGLYIIDDVDGCLCWR